MTSQNISSGPHLHPVNAHAPTGPRIEPRQTLVVRTDTDSSEDRAESGRQNLFDGLPVGPGSSAPADRPEVLQTARDIINQLMQSEEFGSILTIIQVADEMKKAAMDMISDGSGAADNGVMTAFNEVLEDAKALISLAKKGQDNVNESMQTLTR